MGRDTPEAAVYSLFIEEIKQKFMAADADLVARAYAFSKERVRGEGSVPFRAADLLLKQNADAVTIACALLAPILWQGLANVVEIEKHFGRTIAAALQDLDPHSVQRHENQPYRRENVGSLLASMGTVPRKTLLLIVFRLLALEEATVSREADAGQMARETLDFYVPIADRLSLGELRRQLEDASFQILDFQGYADLRQKLIPIQAEDDKCLSILLSVVRRMLHSNGIEGRVHGRTKGLHSVRRKMIRTGKTLEQIMDRVGLRVIVRSVPDCYAVLGLLHSHFKPIPGTFDDYIGLPKDNGYQSLHTCVYPVREVSRKPIEFQIRTELMHAEAEHGTAAHWRYKSDAEVTERDRQRAQWMMGLARQYEESDSTEAFIDLLYRQVFRDHLVVFGNGGRIVRLFERATVRDYLSIINIRFPRGAAVRVNGKTADMNQMLRDGDSIEVLVGGDSPSGRISVDRSRHWFDDRADSHPAAVLRRES
jgi:GTP pyrophosphokinase